MPAVRSSTATGRRWAAELRRVLLPFTVVVSVLAGGPAAATIHDGHLWLAAVGSGPLGLDRHDRLLGWLELQTRFDDDMGHLFTTIARPGIGWRVNEKLDLWAGYARIDTLRESANDTGENRFWQQASFAIAKPFGGALSGRTRLEQRWDDRGDDVGWRLRQFVRYAYRFEGTRWSLVVFDEIFLAFNDTDWGANAGFDQNRAFLGAAVHLTDIVRVEGGYMNQFVERDSASNSSNHIFLLSLFVSR